MRAIWPTATVIALFLLILAAVKIPHLRVWYLGFAVWMGAGTFMAFGWALQRRKGWISIEGGEPLPDPELDRLSKYAYRAEVHQTPEHDAVPQVTPCCSVPLPDLPPDEPFTHEPQKVTCQGGEPT